MIEVLKDFVDRFPLEKSYQGWFVSTEGVAICTQDMKSEDFLQSYPAFSSVLFLTPGVLFFAEEDGTFDLDRAPDFFAVPNTELGVEILEAARAVTALENIGDELQDTYMETLDQWWRVDRLCRGLDTRTTILDVVNSQAAEFDTHRTEEKEARARLMGLLVQFRTGDSSAKVVELDLTLSKDTDGYSDEDGDESEEGEGPTVH